MKHIRRAVYKVLEFWEDLKWSVATLWRQHTKYMITSTAIGVVTGLIAWWNTGSTEGSLSFQVSTVLLSLSISILAAFIIEALTLFRLIWGEERIQRHFRQFWGLSSPTAKAALVVPRFQGPLKLIWQKQLEGWPSYGRAVSRESDREVELCARSDLFAASSIISSFSETGLPAPTVIWDKDATDSVLNSTNDYEVLIAVGLFSNDLVKWANGQSNLNRLFELVEVWPERSDQKVDGSEGQIWLMTRTDGRLNRLDHSRWKRFRRVSGQEDQVLIAKVKLASGGKTVFIVGGIGSTGTEFVGGYLRREWRNLLHRYDPETADEIGDNEFSMVVTVPSGKNKSMTSISESHLIVHRDC